MHFVVPLDWVRVAYISELLLLLVDKFVTCNDINSRRQVKLLSSDHSLINIICAAAMLVYVFVKVDCVNKSCILFIGLLLTP
jgi:hypothetical protein